MKNSCELFEIKKIFVQFELLTRKSFAGWKALL